MKADEFSLPYKKRTRPEEIPAPVWEAFAESADHQGSHDGWLEKWRAFQAVHQQYYNSDGTLKPRPDDEKQITD